MLEPAEEIDQDDQVKQLKNQINILNEEILSLKDQSLRAIADADNYKKRLDKESQEAKSFAAVSIIKQLLPAIENLEKTLEAAKHEKSTFETLITGVTITIEEIFNILKKLGLEKIEIPSRKFDPAICEAVGVISSGTCDEGEIANLLLAGYKFKGRVIRHAKVQIESALDN
ncbi:MAG: nucleotide exchange factor GrpE [Nitrospinota bacterium]